ncbi:MAG: phage protein Gp36 family protein [Planctomycetota bacterium]
MAYITTSDLSQRLGTTLYARLTDRVSGTTASSTVAQQIIDEAHGLANSYLCKRYATPIDLVSHPELNSLLQSRVLDIAEYLAWRGSPFVNDVPNRIQSLYDDARQWFESVAAGEIHLPADSPPSGRVAEDDSPRFNSRPREFTADELDGL